MRQRILLQDNFDSRTTLEGTKAVKGKRAASDSMRAAADAIWTKKKICSPVSMGT